MSGLAITVITYVAVLSVFIWGIRFAGPKGKFHEDFMTMESTKCLRGLAAMLILFHHISQEEKFMNENVIQAFNRLGPALVAIFFFCSGYGLIKNLDSRPDYLNGFLKKRLGTGLLIPFYVNTLLYGLYYFIIGVRYKPLQLVAKLTGFSLMDGFAWFPVVLIILYVSFYFIFKNIQNRRVCYLLMLLVILFQGVFFAHWGHFAWWGNPERGWWLESDKVFTFVPWWMKERALWFSGEWWVNSSIGFYVGMFFAQREEKLLEFFKKKYCLKLIVFTLLLVVFNLITMFGQMFFGYYSEYWTEGPGVLFKLITYASQLPQIASFLVVVYLIRMKIKVNNPIVRFFGKYSLHTYLMNLMALSMFEFLLGNKIKKAIGFGFLNFMIFIVATIAISVIFGVFEERICFLLNQLLSKKKPAKEN